MTNEELQVIKERAEKATEGPWVEYLDEPNSSGYVEVPEFIHKHDAEFIAHARQDVPNLLAEVERLTAELDSTRQELRCAGHATATVYNKELAKLRKALEFYADETNHTEPRGAHVFGDVFYDKGKIAREALK